MDGRHTSVRKILLNRVMGMADLDLGFGARIVRVDAKTLYRSDGWMIKLGYCPYLRLQVCVEMLMDDLSRLDLKPAKALVSS